MFLALALLPCFTPGMNCTQNIVDKINAAHTSIYMQAYSFTSKTIEQALINAKKRGVDVEVILDKTNFTSRPSFVPDLKGAKIPVWDDYKPAIAHNKVIIIDMDEVFTGSFNFTDAAQNRNAENSIDIVDSGLAAKYYQNWLNRKAVSLEK